MPDDLSNSVVSRVALVVKNMYRMLRCRAQRISHYDPAERKYGKYWRNVAIICIQRRINPAEFVEVQFHCMKPWPDMSQLCTESALERYYKSGSEYAASYAIEFNGQLQIFSRLVEIGKTPRAALEEGQRFDPLFTYAVAVANGFTDLIRETEEAALARFLTSVHYEQVYRDVIPESFKVKAREVWEGANAHGLDGRPASAPDTGSEGDREIVL